MSQQCFLYIVFSLLSELIQFTNNKKDDDNGPKENDSPSSGIKPDPELFAGRFSSDGDFVGVSSKLGVDECNLEPFVIVNLKVVVLPGLVVLYTLVIPELVRHI